MVRKAVKKARKWERWQDRERERAEQAAAADRTREPGGAEAASAPAVLIDPRDTRRDCGLVNRAVRERWPIGRSKARTIVSRLMGIVETREVLTPSGDGGMIPDTGRADANAIAAAKVLVGMVQHNHRERSEGRGTTINVGVAVNGGTDDRRNQTLAIAQRIRAGRIS